MSADDFLKRELPASIASQFDADVPPVLLGPQSQWVSDPSPFKVVEKSRRVGLTWAEAADNVTIAARKGSAGGMNCYYIGYNMDMAIEFIEACAMWARVLNEVVSEVEPGTDVFGDGNEERAIKTYTIRFASGFRIVALSSRPANLRGKQGVVTIDEAAFHCSLGELLKSAMALLLWGGKVRVISTHNGDQNEFNELLNEIRSRKRKGTIHRITFREAIAAGLYERVCMRRGVAWSAEGQAEWIDDAYGYYGESAEEELDVVPSQGSGAWLSSALIEARMYDAPVLRYSCPTGFERLPDDERYARVQEWLDESVAPLLAALDPELSSALGQDFGRSGDLTVVVPAQIEQNLRRRVPFVLELRNMPHRQQHQVDSFVISRLPRFQKGALDARGNGHALAEMLAQDFGWAHIELVMFSEHWYREHMPSVKSAFEDDLIALPRDNDIVVDLRAIKMISGVARVPDKRTTGADGGKRHGDAGIAVALMHYASKRDVEIIDYHRVQPSSHLPRLITRGAGWRSQKGIW